MKATLRLTGRINYHSLPHTCFFLYPDTRLIGRSEDLLSFANRAQGPRHDLAASSWRLGLVIMTLRSVVKPMQAIDFGEANPSGHREFVLVLRCCSSSLGWRDLVVRAVVATEMGRGLVGSTWVP